MPNDVLDTDRIVKDRAIHSAIHPSHARAMLESIEEYILDELSRGNQLNFGLASFSPLPAENAVLEDTRLPFFHAERVKVFLRRREYV